MLIKCRKGHKSLGSLCNVKSKSQWVSESVSEWQGHLLSCSGQLNSPDCKSYDEALDKTKLERLDKRRIVLSLNFAKKATKHPEHSKWFSKQDVNTNVKTRALKPQYKPVQARTNRLLKSPVPYLTQLLNNDAAENIRSWALFVLLVILCNWY